MQVGLDLQYLRRNRDEVWIVTWAALGPIAVEEYRQHLPDRREFKRSPTPGRFQGRRTGHLIVRTPGVGLVVAGVVQEEFVDTVSVKLPAGLPERPLVLPLTRMLNFAH